MYKQDYYHSPEKVHSSFCYIAHAAPPHSEGFAGIRQNASTLPPLLKKSLISITIELYEIKKRAIKK